jgi:DnaK suppressor protein
LISLSPVDPERARELLQHERVRIERAMTALDREGPLEGSDRREPGDLETESLYQDERDEGRRQELKTDLAALERAESRLNDGTYGLSVESGQPIPDARLEALPTAERTIEEEERFRGR